MLQMHQLFKLGNQKPESNFSYTCTQTKKGLPIWHYSEKPTCQYRRHKRRGFDPWVGKIPWRRAWQPTLVFLPGKSYGQRSLVGYDP